MSEGSTAVLSYDDVVAMGIDLIEELHRVILNQFENPYPILRDLREQGAVYSGDAAMEYCGVQYSRSNPRGDRPVFSILGHDAALKVLGDAETFSSTVLQETVGTSMGASVAMIDPPDHERVRSLLHETFTRDSVGQLQHDLAQPLARRLVDGFADRKRADLMEEVAVRFPVLMINSLFGLPLDRAMELNQISSGMLLATAASPNGLTEAASLSAISRACGQRLGEILLEVIEEHRQTPRDDLVGMMLKASDSAEAPLNQAEMLANLRNLLPAGGETTSKGIGALLVGLLTAPEQLAKVRADRSLIPAAIEEAIRWESPDQFLFRVALRDSEIAGVSIPAGSGVTVCVGSANHDETVWEHPDEYDIDRPSRHHVGFSHGPHTCLGMRLARMELETLLNELLDRLPNLRLDPDQPTPTIRGTAFRSATTIPAIWD